MELITINKIELASELAHERAMNEMINNMIIIDESEMYIEDENGDTHYTDEAQEVFNGWYDYFLSKIEEVATK